MIEAERVSVPSPTWAPPTSGDAAPSSPYGQGNRGKNESNDHQIESGSNPNHSWNTRASSGDNSDTDDAINKTDDEQQQPPLPFSKARCIALLTHTTSPFEQTLSLQTVVIILPTIGEALSIPESRLQWIVSSYSLAFGCFLLLWGRIADIYGKRLIFIAGSVWVTVIIAVTPFLPNEIAFDLFRALHGLGAAANVPTAIGILGVTFAPGRAKNYAFSTYAAGAPLGSVFGNIVSGLIAEYASWKWVFGASAIMAGAISVLGIIVIPPPPPAVTRALEGGGDRKSAASVDWIGAFLVTVGLLLLLFALTEGNVVGWSTPWVSALIVVSLLIVAAFVFWQRHLEKSGGRAPLVKVSLFGNLRFSAVMLIMCVFFASFNNYLIFATYFFQNYQGLSPLQTMLRFIPTGIGGCIVAAVVARILDRVPTVFILLCGNLSVSVACLLFAVPIPPSTSYFAWALWAMLLSVIGADTTWPSLTLFTSRSLPPEDQAVGGALINAAGQLGRAVGLAISTATQTAVMASARGVPVEHAGGMEAWDPPTLRGIRAANWVNFGLGVASLVIVPFAFRSMEIVGRAAPPSEKSNADGGEEGIMHETKVNEQKRPEPADSGDVRLQQ
ncbi:putative MFS-type transporter -like protein [Hapsidospora chrysogenum ATCC 11550]|uniref:Putative MFS-type transporter-like protein n=1 Tax=Hapsidospora chrysogenum (strain ATCC 11550 / CBS 779.69 / DSM 880 / IAM 14645 / JCM 23072 / IMI 49137) TaxID=857340 RepID=A0A086TD77_HAPC1|nr:putative MFS-type transporter -like protein [Hapsidospora chrysogenum ATCC 11550]